MNAFFLCFVCVVVALDGRDGDTCLKSVVVVAKMRVGEVVNERENAN